MATVKLSRAVGSTGLPQLAEDLSWPSAQSGGQVSLAGIDVQGSLQPVFSLSGKRALSRILVTSVIAETITVKLTIDGKVKWNATFTSNITENLLGISNVIPETYIAEESILFEMETLTDTTINVAYLARPIE